jgi:phosphoribosylanthranilate isomerase
MTVRVNICGTTRMEDALFARDAGADYLGFILYDRSPRYIEPDKIKEITEGLRGDEGGPLLIGVFVNESVEFMASVLDSCGLDLAQLSGEEPPEFITTPSSPLYGRSFKGIQPRNDEEATSDAERFRPPSPAKHQPFLLVDAYHKTLRGGTGEQGDWTLASRLSHLTPRLMLAGGLNPDNVAEAVKVVQPYAVDVSSGVENSPGIKDHEKIQAFIRAAKDPSSNRAG